MELYNPLFPGCDYGSIRYPHNFDEDPDPDLDPACYFDADSVTLMWVRIRIRILPSTLMRIRISIPASKKRLKTLKKCSKWLIFHTFWLVICKLMRIRIRIRSYLSIWCGCWYESGSYLLIWCGSESSTLDYGTADIKEYSLKQNCANNKQSWKILQFIQKGIKY